MGSEGQQGGQGAASGAGAAGAGEGGTALVPSGRLREETAARDAALARVTELEGKLAGVETERSSWHAERDLYRAGITDPEGVEVALFLYGKLPAKDRQKPPGLWGQGVNHA